MGEECFLRFGVTSRLLAIVLLGFSCCSANETKPRDETSDRRDGAILDGRWQTDAERRYEALRVVLLIDRSASMQFADPQSGGHSQVQRAVRELIGTHRGNDSVAFALVRYDNRLAVNAETGAFFTNDPEVLDQAISDLARVGGQADAQGALMVAVEGIVADVENLSDSHRAGTRYQVVLVADGLPTPRCRPGCNNDTMKLGEAEVPALCDLPRDQWCKTLSLDGEACQELAEALPYYDTPCVSYNDDASLSKLGTELITETTRLGAASARLHTVFLSSLNTAGTDIQQLFAYDPAAATTLLQSLAAAGNGTYRAVEDPAALSLLFLTPQ